MGEIEKKILFLGGLFPKEQEAEILNNSIGQPQNAANILQWSIIRGLDMHLETPIRIINSLFIGAYPNRYKKLWIPRTLFSHTEHGSQNDINTGFLNLPVAKHFFKYRSICRELRRSGINGEDMILGYSMTLSVVKGLLYAKRIAPNVLTCLIVPDLPEYMSFSKGPWINELLHRVNRKMLYRYIKKIDSFVVLTQQMSSALQIGKRPYAVMEGICPENCYPSQSVSFTELASSEKKVILYTGTLDAAYGIVDLIEAFHRIEDDTVELVICGGGNAEPLVRKMTDEDHRVKYLGILHPNQVREMQQKAYLLVNPRSNAEFTKYSFPSKTMEYMASGRPVLMYHLHGIPKEYDDYLLYISDTQDGLYLSLREALSTECVKMNELGQKAQAFVREQKNAFVQTKKIIDILQYDAG